MTEDTCPVAFSQPTTQHYLNRGRQDNLFSFDASGTKNVPRDPHIRCNFCSDGTSSLAPTSLVEKPITPIFTCQSLPCCGYFVTTHGSLQIIKILLRDSSIDFRQDSINFMTEDTTNFHTRRSHQGWIRQHNFQRPLLLFRLLHFPRL